MNQRCAPSRGGCGTWFTVGAKICPHCQQRADLIGELNMGARPAVGDAEPAEVTEQRGKDDAPDSQFEDHADRPFNIGEQSSEDVSDLAPVGAAQRSRKPATNKPSSDKATNK